MNKDAFDSLTPQEREELALCGISTQEQLRRTSINQLLRDLEQGRQFFPDKKFTLSEQRIREMYAGMGGEAEAAEPSAPDFPGKRSSEPTSGFRHRTKEESKRMRQEKKRMGNILHSPVRCSHPFTAILAAFCTLFLIIPLASIVVFPVLMITDNMPDIPVEVLAVIVFGIPCLVYMFVARRATCPVCHMRIFRFSHYTRNRAAHHLPLLGYNFTTALHLLLFWRYNCPGCGTPVKLIGAKGHRTHC